MPSTPKTDAAAIVRAARALIVATGVDGLSMQAVAQAVGVKAPSLYKHYADRAALVRAVSRRVVAELQRLLARTPAGPPDERLRSYAQIQRRYALRRPRLYGLLFTPRTGELALPAADYQALSAPILAACRDLDPQAALPSARALIAFCHGFVTLELAGAFQLGGNLDAAFDAGLALVVPHRRRS